MNFYIKLYWAVVVLLVLPFIVSLAGFVLIPLVFSNSYAGFLFLAPLYYSFWPFIAGSVLALVGFILERSKGSKSSAISQTSGVARLIMRLFYVVMALAFGVALLILTVSYFA